MSPLWTSRAAEAATGGTSTASWEATGVSIDTRTLRPGDLFVALRAARDGHEFAAQAFEAGAAAALVTRVPEGVTGPCLVVPEVLAALEDLGRAARARLAPRARIAAITGSVGKTSAKEMLRSVLAPQGRTHAAEASYNNHWGVPLTLARMPADTEFGVFEVGMNAPGEIAPLVAQVRPHVALITTIGTAHLEAFGRIEGIAEEKASIFTGLEPGGTAVYPGDLPTTPILAAVAAGHAAREITFGTRPADHHRMIRAEIVDQTTVATARAWRTPLLYKVRSPGRHFALNALGVLATARALGADRARSLMGLGAWVPPAGRGQRETIVRDPQSEGMSFDLIDDAFNANPTSMTAALEVLAAARTRDGVGLKGRGRRIAILGDMLELGPGEAALHAAIAGDPSLAAIDLVHCAGPRMRALYEALPPAKRGRYAAAADDLAAEAGQLVDAGDVVLVKGSKGSRVARVVDALRKLRHPDASPDRED